MRPVTVIIPTWNMGRFLTALTHSILHSPLAAHVEEIIFVCEKSNDGSESVIEYLSQAQGDELPRIRMIQPEVRNGLFAARLLGAQAATTKKIMFIDSRITLPEVSGHALSKLIYEYPALVANVDINVNKNVFCMYWQRSHEALFKTTFEANRHLNKVTEANFDKMKIGGTCFFCSRDLFIQASEKYAHRKTFSDDTLIMSEMVKTEPFFVHPDFRILWEPRDRLVPFLKHLYARGPGLAEYHFFEKRGLLFYAEMAGLVFLAISLGMTLVKPAVGLMILMIGVVALILSTILIVKNASEFLMLAPLHAAVLVAYGVGALKGAYVIWRTRRNPPPMVFDDLSNKNDPAA